MRNPVAKVETAKPEAVKVVTLKDGSTITLYYSGTLKQYVYIG